ncbi:hypothetical protein GCM10011402_23680 [Paracoccus acridae]|uniref:DUF2937 family protein n=1 Tax=Paracoccus acridae TaxID=1795310 RepID=A0ABQ1VKF8_9RHOB|nr:MULTISPECIES: DUF2937 family protein [Paracoccus]GGF70385.1 hypothetical protein GCM10011402_23680 [Paracoccus acridae]
MIGILRLAVAVCVAIVLSQFPAFSDQYVQRLGGQVDALSRVAAEFDASAQGAGLTRERALADLSGSAFRDAHQSNMRDVFARLDRARQDLELLRLAGPLERMLLPHRIRDGETLAATWGDFRPAVPVTVAGLWAAGIGLVLGWLLAGLAGRVFRRPQDRLGWR